MCTPKDTCVYCGPAVLKTGSLCRVDRLGMASMVCQENQERRLAKHTQHTMRDCKLVRKSCGVAYKVFSHERRGSRDRKDILDR